MTTTSEGTTTKRNARRRGLRMAAKVATVAGLLAAASAPAEAAQAEEGLASAGERAASVDLAENIRLHGSKGGCGCAPCWGPPAPPSADWHEVMA